MTTIKISNFGGEFPRVLARDLPAEGAQVNQNLLATSQDFRPVLGTADVSGVVAPANAVSLYRTQRNTDGTLLTNLATGWIASASDISHVRGQVTDDTTERTYYTTNDGSAPPRVRNNAGEDYLLGIPRPPKPEVSILTAIKLSLDQANKWRPSLNTTVSNYVLARVDEDQTKARGVTDMIFWAGITAFTAQTSTTTYQYFLTTPFQRGLNEPYNVMIAIPSYLVTPQGLGSPLLGGILTASGDMWLGVPVFPLWGMLDRAGLVADLGLIKSPTSTTEPLWNAAQIAYIADEMVEFFRPTHYPEVLTRRATLDSLYVDYINNASYLIVNRTAPVQLLTETDPAYAIRVADWKNQVAAAVSSMVSLSIKMRNVSHEIEDIYAKMKANFQATVVGFLNNIPLEKTEVDFNGLVAIDSDSVPEDRFYVTTYVTGWGEESAPSEPSDLLTVTRNDLVAINQPSRADVASGRNIAKYRVYRTNAGTNNSEFQFVAEQAYTDTVPAPYTGYGQVGVPLVGFGDKDKWRDVVATWVVYVSARGVSSSSPVDAFRDTSKLRVGDTITQHNSNQNTATPTNATYLIKKTWNGGEWVLQNVPSISNRIGLSQYIDGRYAASLGEVCPSVSWSPPPYRCDVIPNARIPTPKGTNPYLRGMVGMPNGIMAAFVDNFVVFFEPYVSYAAPIEYQVPLEFPIVGLCAFGQSLLVGTRANPYIISGADSASMSSRKINVSQSCVSAKSMVPAMGGVFYASPDGYCYANESTVEVITTGMFSNEDWRNLNPSSIFAAVHDNVLYFWYSGGLAGSGCYGLDFAARKLTRHVLPATAAFEDVVTDSVYITYAGTIKQLFAGNRVQGYWKSGKLTLPKQESLAWMRVLSDFGAYSVTVSWWGDGVLRHTATFTNTEPQRIPMGRYLEHEFEVRSNGRVSSVAIASTTEELRAS